MGNSVARPVALTLGVSLRTAWLANTARQETPAVRVDAALEDSLDGIYDHCKIKSPVVASEESASNGWSPRNMLNNFSAALTSPKALVSSISDALGEPLTNGDHNAARNTEAQSLKSMDTVKACRTGFEYLSVVTNGNYGTSRLKPYRLEQDEPSSDLDTSATIAETINTD